MMRAVLPIAFSEAKTEQLRSPGMNCLGLSSIHHCHLCQQRCRVGELDPFFSRRSKLPLPFSVAKSN
jgi:hypothetical protein